MDLDTNASFDFSDSLDEGDEYEEDGFVVNSNEILVDTSNNPTVDIDTSNIIHSSKRRRVAPDRFVSDEIPEDDFSDTDVTVQTDDEGDDSEDEDDSSYRPDEGESDEDTSCEDSNEDEGDSPVVTQRPAISAVVEDSE
jgi:hypothetical protein